MAFEFGPMEGFLCRTQASAGNTLPEGYRREIHLQIRWRDSRHSPHRWGSTTMAREKANCEPSLHNLFGEM